MSVNKEILVDCDGCLVDWIQPFDHYMKNEVGVDVIDDTAYDVTKRFGLDDEIVDTYNKTERIRHLPAYADSVDFVSKLANKGFRFSVISSLNDDEKAAGYRKENLLNLFGDVFNEIICLNWNIKKIDVLKEKWLNSNCYWIEDYPRNLLGTKDIGLRPILISQVYNQALEVDALRVSNQKPWEEIYHIIMEGK